LRFPILSGQYKCQSIKRCWPFRNPVAGFEVSRGWPVHAAQTLRIKDPLELLPPSYASWLRRREKVRKLYPTGRQQV
jgi:hypothetical protein